MIVIDIGCARHGNDYSIERLIEEFHPEILYGFDPHPATTAVPPGQCDSYAIDDTVVFVERLAAWIYDGEIGFRQDGLNSWITELKGAEQVRCFDLAKFIENRAPDKEIVLKIDAEGSEYDLLRHLILRGADKRLKLAWIEWHEPDRGRAKIEEEISCEIAEWRW